MPKLRAALVPLLLLAPPGAPAEDELVFRVAAGTTLARTLESGYSMELESMRMQLDGEEVPVQAFGVFHLALEHAESYVLTDTFERVAAEGPRRVRRSFERLEGTESTRLTGDEGSSDQATRYASALAGKSVVFEWDEEAALFAAAFAEGQEGDASLLAALEEDLDLRRLLPRAPVAPGSSWTIDARAFQCLLDPGGDLALRAEGGASKDSSATDAQLRDNLAGEFTATYAGTETVGGVRVARVTLAVDTRTHAESALAPEALPAGGSGTERVETTFALAGELRWDLDHGHALALELAGPNGLVMTQTLRAELDGQAYEQVQTMVFAGELRFRMRVERR